MWEIAIWNLKEKTKQEQKIRAEETEKKIRMEALISWGNYVDKRKQTEDFFRRLDEIPAYIVSEKLLPQFKFHTNERNFLSDTKTGNKFTAFFYSKELNAIVNWGSHHYNFWDTNSWYSPTVLVKNQLWLEWKEVVQRFKENFNL